MGQLQRGIRHVDFGRLARVDGTIQLYVWTSARDTEHGSGDDEFSVPDAWDLSNGYGPQPFDVKFLYNLTMPYQPQWYKGQHDWKGRLLGGWSFAPLFTARSGYPLAVNVAEGNGGDCQAFGEGDCSFFGTDEGAVFTGTSGVNTARGAWHKPSLNHSHLACWLERKHGEWWIWVEHVCGSASCVQFLQGADSRC